MPTILSHALVGAGLGAAVAGPELPRRLLILGACGAAFPDLDVTGLAVGFHLDHPLGHRGLSHSLAFAALVGTLTGLAVPRGVRGAAAWRLSVVVFLATASHGVLDAFTNGGRGVAFFAPFSNARFHFPFQPIEVSPLSAREFFGPRGVTILANEAVWIWVPLLALVGVAVAWRRRSSRGRGRRGEGGGLIAVS